MKMPNFQIRSTLSESYVNQEMWLELCPWCFENQISGSFISNAFWPCRMWKEIPNGSNTICTDSILDQINPNWTALMTLGRRENSVGWSFRKNSAPEFANIEGYQGVEWKDGNSDFSLVKVDQSLFGTSLAIPAVFPNRNVYPRTEWSWWLKRCFDKHWKHLTQMAEKTRETARLVSALNTMGYGQFRDVQAFW